MARYGYQDMPDDHSDVCTERTIALCPDCGQTHTAMVEDCDFCDGAPVCPCGCTEMGDGVRGG